MSAAFQFLPAPPDASLIYSGSFSAPWVVISIAIAILSAYAALNASDRLSHFHRTSSRLVWVLISSLTLGVGVWAMHFIGMLALNLPCGVYYDPLITLLSMIPGILASGVALGLAWYHGHKHWPLVVSSLLLGAGIGTMHYTGMAAMQLEGVVRYDPFLFYLSVIVAVVLAYLALRINSGLACAKKRCNVLAALVLGGAISGMHYTAMAAAYFVRGDAAALPSSVFTSNTLAVIVALATIFLAMAAMVLAAISRNREMTDQLSIAAVAFQSREGILISDANGVIIRVNRAFSDITGYAEADVVGKNPNILNSGRQDKAFYQEMWRNLNTTGTWAGEIWNRRKNGEVYPEHLTINAVYAPDGEVINYVAALTDITSRKAAADEIRNLAFYDPLTKLPNRRLLVDRLEHALAASTRKGREGALLFIDLDNFKALNDSLGHDTGDMLLQQVAERLVTCVREGDTVARLGGDEFVVMLEELNSAHIEAAAQTKIVGEKILFTLNQPYQLGTHRYHSTPSIGAALFSDRHEAADSLFRQADIAMYQAKKDGRNTLRFFDPAMQATIAARTSLEADLRHAIVEQQGLLLYYQGQVDSNGHLTGAEALVRWNHPERGIVQPAQFIPLAEETGLILPLGYWVLETACRQLASWGTRTKTAHLTLSVNISAKQFHLPTFADEVLALIDHFGVNPARLELEITEGMLLNNVEDIIRKMKLLKARGVKFSLDDFGTGYSSLQYLKQLPLDQIKIDQSFVRDISVDDNDKAIVRTIVAMAGSLKLEVIAEGVEREEQRKNLQDSGCANFQGYLFARPMTIGQFDELLKQRNGE